MTQIILRSILLSYTTEALFYDHHGNECILYSPSVMVTAIRNEESEPSSNPGRD